MSESPTTPTSDTEMSGQHRPFFTPGTPRHNGESESQRARSMGAESAPHRESTTSNAEELIERPDIDDAASEAPSSLALNDEEMAEILLSVSEPAQTIEAQTAEAEVSPNPSDSDDEPLIKKRKRNNADDAESTAPSSKRKMPALEETAKKTTPSGKTPLKKRPAKKAYGKKVSAKQAPAEKVTLSLATPEDGKPAHVGKPDPSKFKLNRIYDNGPKKGELKVDLYNPKLVAEFDFNNASHVKKLNAWASQLIKRGGLSRREKDRNRWTETEVEILRQIVARHMEEAGNRRRLNWQNIAEEYNEAIRGLWAEVGDICAKTTSSAKRYEETSFNMPEEDLKEPEQETSEPWAKEVKKKAAKTGRRGLQTYYIQERYMYLQRPWTAIRSHAQQLPSILDELNGGYDEDPNASGDEDEEDFAIEPINNGEDADASGEGSNNGEADDVENAEDHGEGPSTMPDATPSGNDILDNPNNYGIEDRRAHGHREEDLTNPRQIAKDKAGSKWWRGG